MPSLEKTLKIACCAGFALATTACGGPSLTTAASEPGCAQCSVFAESDNLLVALASHDDTLFTLDSSGIIVSVPKVGGDVDGLVPPGSNAVSFGVSATSLAWVAPPDPSGTQTSNTLQAIGRDGSAGPALADFQGSALVTVALGDAFVAAFSGDMTGAEMLRYSLVSGDASTPTETLTDEEQTELPLAAGGDAEAVWCRTHTDSSSSLWRLGTSGDPSETAYPFSCTGLWSMGNGQVFVRDQSTGMNCYYLVDASGQSQQLTCSASDYEQLIPLADGSVAFIAAGAAVGRVDSSGQVSTLFRAENLVGLQSDGDELYYATAAHLGSVDWRQLL